MAKIGITDAVTGETEVREMSASELAEYNSLIADVQARKAETESAKESAETALLSSLGISKEQAVVLGLIQPDYVKPSTSSEA